MDKKIQFLEFFNELLHEHELTRKQFSTQSGIPYPTVIGWTNLGRLPDFIALKKIADFFECSVDYLMGREVETGTMIIPQTLFPAEEKMLEEYRALTLEEKTNIAKLITCLYKKGNL